MGSTAFSILLCLNVCSEIVDHSHTHIIPLGRSCYSCCVSPQTHQTSLGKGFLCQSLCNQRYGSQTRYSPPFSHLLFNTHPASNQNEAQPCCCLCVPSLFIFSVQSSLCFFKPLSCSTTHYAIHHF